MDGCLGGKLTSFQLFSGEKSTFCSIKSLCVCEKIVCTIYYMWPQEMYLCMDFFVFPPQAPDGESQPSTEVDLFISTEKIMVLNTDLKVKILNRLLTAQQIIQRR